LNNKINYLLKRFADSLKNLQISKDEIIKL